MTATGSRPTATDAKDRLDGADLVAMFTAAAAALQRNIEPINALNVFPVPTATPARTCTSPCRAALTIWGA